MRLRTIRAASGDTLCRSCDHSFIRIQDGEEIFRCMLSHGYAVSRIEGRVSECNKYEKRDALSKYDLEKQAWIIQIGASGEKIGFVRPGTREHKRLIDD